MKFICKNCGIEFQNTHQRKYCTQKCYWNDLKELRKGEDNPFYNQKHNNLTKKIWAAHDRGKIKTEEHKKRIGLAHKGKIVSIASRKKSSETKKRLFLEGKLKGPNLGKPMKESSRLKMIASKKGKPSKLKGTKATIIARKRMSESKIRLIKEGKIVPHDLSKYNNIKNSNTKPEQIICKYLEDSGLIKGIDFYQNYWINNIEHRYKADFVLPQINTIIECDGDFWHGNNNSIPKTGFIERQTKHIELDIIRNTELRNKGYSVLRFWETDIHKNFDKVKKSVDLFINILKGDYNRI